MGIAHAADPLSARVEDRDGDVATQRRDTPKTPIGPTYCIRRRQKPGRATGAWEVILHRDARIVAYQHFADSKHGGYEAAFYVALAYRDAMLQRHPPAPRAVINQRLRVSNRTGYPGVIEVQSRGKLQGYAAETVLPGRDKLHTYYSVAEYGKRQAFELAVVERQRQLHSVKGGVFRIVKPLPHQLSIPTPPPVTDQDLVPRPKSSTPKRAPRAAYDPEREEGVAQAILRQYGRTRPHQPGAPELRGIRRYHRHDRGSPSGGWQVLIYYRKRRLSTRIFMDRPHGGAANAFEKARQARDAIVRRHLPLLQSSGYTGCLPEMPDQGAKPPGAPRR